MRILTFILALVFANLGVAPAAKAAELIAAVKADNEFHTVAGEVITIWYDTLLLDDGTGQMIVSVAPTTVRDLKLDSRINITVTGKLKAGAFVPLVLINNSNGDKYEFEREENAYTLAPMNDDEVTTNNRRYTR